MQLLLIDASDALAAGATQAIARVGGQALRAESYAEALRIATTRHIDTVIVGDPSKSRLPGGLDLTTLGTVLAQKRIALLTVGDPPHAAPIDRRVWIGSIDAAVTAEELAGRLATIATYHRIVKDLESELRSLDLLSTRLRAHFAEVDQELQLASRLQRDFLPKSGADLPGIRFSAVYRPASWVSGDMYDVFRVDEHRVGYYLADAVGHGMAAGLLTMFIKQAVTAKQIEGDSYRLLTPDEMLRGLNAALVDQNLPNCRFVTACCGLYDVETRTLSYARGGHPFPIHISKDGRLQPLRSEGGLLGLHRGATFPTGTVRLEPGEKLLLYSDGVETAFPANSAGEWDTTAYLSAFESVAHQPVDELVASIEQVLSGQQGSIAPSDDVTILAIEITE